MNMFSSFDITCHADEGDIDMYDAIQEWLHDNEAEENTETKNNKTEGK